MPSLKSDNAFSFRPRILIKAVQGQSLGSYVGPAILHHLEKLPCHKLDIPVLYSSSVRTPEEALFHLFHEAKRTVPSIIYMPHIAKLWKIMGQSVRETFNSLLDSILPNSPLLLLALMEEDEEEEVDFTPDMLFSKRDEEIFDVAVPESSERKEFFSPIVKAALEPVPASETHEELEELEVLPAIECRSLSEKEEKRLRKREEKIQRELRIFLRYIKNVNHLFIFY